jgi:hypothetical protein
MRNQKVLLLGTALVLMLGTAIFLGRLRTHQRIGEPAVKTRAIAGSRNLEVELPERVLDWGSTPLEVQEIVIKTLPEDTSYAQRIYKAADGFETMVNVVLMGADRTSLHQSEYCLKGQGWHIDPEATTLTQMHMERPEPYELPLMKFVANKDGMRGIYVLWYVAPEEMTASYRELMWLMARDLLRTGVLHRWACVSFFAICPPGGEEAAFARIKSLIAATVPEFQLTHRSSQVATAQP